MAGSPAWRPWTLTTIQGRPLTSQYHFVGVRASWHERTVMTATRHGTVYRIDVETGKSDLVARLDMLALGCNMASDGRGYAYVLEHRGGPLLTA